MTYRLCGVKALGKVTMADLQCSQHSSMEYEDKWASKDRKLSIKFTCLLMKQPAMIVIHDNVF